MRPDFSVHSLVLFHDDQQVFSSKNSGLRPLMQCVVEYKGPRGCILHDKVIGLAAAKLIVYCGFISSVCTGTCSIIAKQFLELNHIPIFADNIVPNILTSDRSAICPGELRAQMIDDPKEFFDVMHKIFYGHDIQKG